MKRFFTLLIFTLLLIVIGLNSIEKVNALGEIDITFANENICNHVANSLNSNQVNNNNKTYIVDNCETNNTLQFASQDDVDDIVYLNLSYVSGIDYTTHVTDLTGITSFTNLTSLYLDDSGLTNYSLLVSFENLKVLSLNEANTNISEVTDITPLKNLTNLEELYLDCNNINNLYSLKSLTKLKKLSLDSNQNINDYSPLSQLTNLEYLSIIDNNVNDISFASELTKLEEIYFGLNHITDVSSIKNILGNITNSEFLYNNVTSIYAKPGDLIALPSIFKDYLDSTSELYTGNALLLVNCDISGNNIVVDEDAEDVASVTITSGIAQGTSINISISENAKDTFEDNDDFSIKLPYKVDGDYDLIATEVSDDVISSSQIHDFVNNIDMGNKTITPIVIHKYQLQNRNDSDNYYTFTNGMMTMQASFPSDYFQFPDYFDFKVALIDPHTLALSDFADARLNDNILTWSINNNANLCREECNIFIIATYGNADVTPYFDNEYTGVFTNGYNSLLISYYADEKFDGIEIYRSTSSTGSFSKITTIPFEDEYDYFYTNTGLTINKTYYYKIRYYKGSGSDITYSKYSVVRGRKVTMGPLFIGATTFNYNSTTFSWEALPKSSRYYIYRSVGNDSNYKYLTYTTKTTFTDKNLQTGQKYYYKVRAYAKINGTVYYGDYGYVNFPTLVLGTPYISAVNSYNYNQARAAVYNQEGANGFEVYEVTNPDAIDDDRIYQKIATIANTSEWNYYTINNLDSFSTHYYVFRAYRIVGTKKVYSDYTQMKSVTLQVGTPTINTKPEDYDKIKVSWTKLSGQYITSYKLERKTYDSDWITIGEAVTNDYYIDEVDENKVYFYRVTAKYDDGIVQKYGESSFEISGLAKAKAPTFTVTNVNYNTIKITINSAGPMRFYNIYRSDSLNGNYSYINSAFFSGESGEYIDTGLTFNKTYYYKMSSTSPSGIPGNLSEETKSIKTKLSTPELTVSQMTYNSLKLSYATPGATSYKIYRATSKSGSYRLIKTTSATTYTNSSLTTGQTYYYKVKAYKTYGGKTYYSSYSSVKYNRVVPATPAVAISVKDLKSLTINYSKISGATKYQIYRSDTIDGTYSKIATTSSTSYISTNLSYYKTYYYKVRAYRTYRGRTTYGNFSNVISGTTYLAVPSISAYSIGDTSIKVVTNDILGANKYRYYVSSDNENWDMIEEKTENTFVMTGLTTGETYYFKVVAVGSNNGIETTSTSTVKSAKPIPATPVLSLSNNNYNKIGISIGVSDNTCNFEIYRATSKTGKYVLIKNLETPCGSILNFVDEGLSFNKTYYYKVRGYSDNNVYGSYTSVKAITTKLLTPNVTLQSTGYNSIKVSYSSVEGATGYRIYRATSKNGNYSLIKTTSATTYTNSSLTTGQTYYYKVKAYRTVSRVKKYSSYSSVKYDKAIPATPAVAISVKDLKSLTINYSKISGATKYQIYRSDTIDGTYSKIATTSSTSYISTNLSYYKTYYYKVRAYRTYRARTTYGNFSNVISGTTYLAVPSISAYSIGDTSIKVVTNDILGANKYRYYVSSDNENWDMIEEKTENTFVMTGLTTGETYYFKVVAVGSNNDIETTSTSTVKSAKPIPATPVLSLSNNNYNKIGISISVSDNTCNFEIYRATSKTGKYVLIKNLETPCGSIVDFVDEGLSFNKTYYYKVRGYSDNNVYGSYTSVKAITTKLLTPNVTLQSTGYNSIKVSYSSVEGATGYRIYRATSKNGSYSLVKITSATSWTNTGLSFNKTYYYKVKAYRTVSRVKYYSSYSSYKYAKTALLAPVINDVYSGIRSANVNYNSISGATGYEIYIKYGMDDQYSLVTKTKSLSYLQTFEEGVDIESIYYKVRAYKVVSGKTYYGSYSNESTYTDR